jgi:hypothetical protein
VTQSDMSNSNNTTRSLGWIKPIIAWSVVPGAFVIVISKEDRDIVTFMAEGVIDIPFHRSRKIALAMAALSWRERSLYGELIKAVWDPHRLRPSDAKPHQNTNVYFVAAFLLPDDERLAIVVGRSKPAQTHLLPTTCKARADTLVAKHREDISKFDERMRRKKQEIDEFFNRPEMKEFSGGDYILADEEARRPLLTANELLPLLPRAIVFAPTSATARIEKHGAKMVAESGLPPSRDGTYVGILPSIIRKGAVGLISWEPYSGLPAYPEIRAALEARLRSAFAKPRQVGLGRPQFDTAFDGSSPVVSSDGGPEEILQALADLGLDRPDADGRAGRSRRERERSGFEALAWYQSHHNWSEETWGIYVDASKLDDLAFSILQDLRSRGGYCPHHLAAFLAFGLTLQHELFHAQVEAASSWLELTSLQPRHLRYERNVYCALRETPDWLEEALANWVAWQWFKSSSVQDMIARYSNRHIEQVVEGCLDVSPPGYRDWRKGRDVGTWRILATQLAQGRPRLSSPSIGLPIESNIAGPFPYDFRPSDIPLRFLGRGLIADRLLGHPATLNVPTRAELERALKYFKHVSDRSGGKGSHEKWTGPDQRAFILPKRDPVSPGVFRTFLGHVGIDKATYLHDVRPHL